jgi:Carboxypeptidase regulatory-like domain
VLCRCLFIGVFVATTACAGSPTGTPTPLPSPPTSGQPSAWHIRLSGVVMDDASVPVPGATITVYPFFGIPEPSPVTVIADANGRYIVTFLGNMAAAVAARRDGFERAYVSAGVTVGATEVRTDITMYSVLRITAGESLRVLVPAASVCGLEDEFLCRTVRVVAPSTGTLLLSVTAESASTRAGIGLTSVAWPRIPRYPCCGAEVRQTVSAGDEIVTAVMIPWTMPPGAVRLETSIQ